MTDDLGHELRALAGSEVEQELARHGRRVAMARPVDDAISGSVYQAGRAPHQVVEEPPL